MCEEEAKRDMRSLDFPADEEDSMRRDRWPYHSSVRRSSVEGARRCAWTVGPPPTVAEGRELICGEPSSAVAVPPRCRQSSALTTRMSPAWAKASPGSFFGARSLRRHYSTAARAPLRSALPRRPSPHPPPVAGRVLFAFRLDVVGCRRCSSRPLVE